MKRKPGRPSRYTTTLAQTLCSRIAQGESLREICLDAAMPGLSTVLDWLRKRPEFATMYKRARLIQAHSLADEVLMVLRSGTFLPADKQVRIKGLTWLAARLHPKKYSERPEVEEADQPVFTVVIREQDFEHAEAAGCA